jgi:LPS-assembly protein
LPIAFAAIFLATLLALPFNSPSLAQGIEEEKPVTLVADELEYDDENQLIIARGNVEVIQGDQILMADEITVFQAENRVRADGNIVLVSPDGQVLFGETAELTNDFSEGFIQAISVLLSDDTRLAAVSGRRVGGTRLELNRVVASPCNECAGGIDRPLWQIKASRVTHNSDTGVVIYRHARLEIFGVPVFYTPFLSHPDPTVKRRTGLLTPTFGSNSDLGLTIRVPLFVTLGRSADILLDPMVTTRETVLLSGEFRKRFNNGEFRTRAGVTKERTGAERVRGHVNADFRFDLNPYWRAGGDINVASDDTFLDRYGIDGSDTLRNHLYVEGFTSRNYAALEAFAFQGLSPEDDQQRTPYIAPDIDISLVGQPKTIGDIIGGRFFADANMRALTRETGVDSQRISLAGGWQLPINGLLGEQWTIEGSVQGDVYHVENHFRIDTGEEFDGFRGRFYPQLKIDWRWPFVRSVSRNIQQFIEPVGQIVISPNGVNKFGIPNEDSILFEFDETALFQGNRFPGLDFLEDGKHAAYGVNFGIFGLGGGNATAFVGQSYQFRENNAALTGTGISDHFSDYVARVDLSPTKYIRLHWKARLDKDSFEARRQEAQGSVGVPVFRVGVNYAFFEALDEFPEREEVTTTISSQFSEHWSFRTEWRRDLATDRNVHYGASLGYKCDCFDGEISWRREFTRNRDVDPEHLFMVRASFKHLGQIQSGF